LQGRNREHVVHVVLTIKPSPAGTKEGPLVGCQRAKGKPCVHDVSPDAVWLQVSPNVAMNDGADMEAAHKVSDQWHTCVAGER
jgi:hypothetical protein